MIRGGGKYCAAAGSGAATATSASPAANRMAFAFMDAFFVCDLLAARRGLSTRQPAEKIPSGAALANSLVRAAVAHRIAALRTYTAVRRANSSTPSPRKARHSRRGQSAGMRQTKRSTAATLPDAGARGRARRSRATTEPRRGSPPSGRRARRRASSSARHKQGAPPRRRGSRMAGGRRYRATRSDAPSVIATSGAGGRVWPPRFGRRAGRGPAGQKQYFHR